MIHVSYSGPPHPVFGLVSMLEDAGYEVTYDPPDLSASEPVTVELWVTDIQVKGTAGIAEVIRDFEDRHNELPLTIQVEP
jgi:hypothetical protein